MPRITGILVVMLALGLALPGAASQILLIDDSPAEGFRYAKQPGDPAWNLDARSSSQELLADLESLGHTVIILPAEMTDPSTWPYADLLIWASSDHPLPLGDPAWRAALRHFVFDGGHLLIEGGDIAFQWIAGDPLFAEKVLQGQAWLGDSDGFMDLFEYQHPLASIPNILPESLFLNSQSYFDADAIQPIPGTFMLYHWADSPLAGALLAYDADPSPYGGQILYYCFNYSALDSDDRLLLLENCVTWLTTIEQGDASFAGEVHLVGESDYSGVKVQVQPGGNWVETTSDGIFLLDGLFGGRRYNLVVSKEGFRSVMVVFEIEEGQQISDLYFSLEPVINVTSCSEPDLPIPDDDPLGLTDEIEISAGGFVESVAVFLDISHTWIGDLVINLESPAGTTCLLHSRSGSTLNEIYGWYPFELDPVQDLDRFANELTDGYWSLHVADMAGADLGTLNAWCLSLTVNDGTNVTETAAMPVARLLPNWPNPFNPKTRLQFNLNRDCSVRLSVLDPQGREIRVLWANPLPSGEHQMEWRGRDDFGRSLPSGLYLLRMEAEGFIQTRKLMLLK